ncbi:hypothetical protein CC2G_004809 [Coprinopsis cinerea AmutBmut pab1-1]|nr:hypothetical protein CC2G_004809 [Coprinopsis cinerea AmutBmut pab1-1]
MEDIEALLLNQQKEIGLLAEKHGWKKEEVDKLVKRTSSYKKERAPNLMNALIHAKSKEVNEGKPEGERLMVHEIRKLVEEDPDMQDLNSEQEAAYKQALQEHRDLKKKGPHVSNRAANVDATLHMLTFQTEFNLHSRSGMAGFCFLTRGHVNDTFIPAWCQTPEPATDDLQTLQKEATKLVQTDPKPTSHPPSQNPLTVL